MLKTKFYVSSDYGTCFIYSTSTQWLSPMCCGYRRIEQMSLIPWRQDDVDKTVTIANNSGLLSERSECPCVYPSTPKSPSKTQPQGISPYTCWGFYSVSSPKWILSLGRKTVSKRLVCESKAIIYWQEQGKWCQKETRHWVAANQIVPQ